MRRKLFTALSLAAMSAAPLLSGCGALDSASVSVGTGVSVAPTWAWSNWDNPYLSGTIAPAPIYHPVTVPWGNPWGPGPAYIPAPPRPSTPVVLPLPAPGPGGPNMGPGPAPNPPQGPAPSPGRPGFGRH